MEDLTNEQLQAIVDLTESRVMNISKDDLRLSESQVLYDAKLEKDVVGYWTTLNGYWKARKLPKCTCLDYDGGFMGKRSKKGKIYNDFMLNDIPCNIEWIKQHKEFMEGWTHNESN